MEQKIELKDIAGYLPYGLLNYNKKDLYTLVTIGNSCIGGKYSLCLNDGIKPILRPISDLYKEIEHNGLKEVPIVELAKISEPKRDWDKFEWKLKNSIAYKGRLYFEFDKHNVRFIYSGLYSTSNYDKLFDYLHSRMFDYRGLIDKGLSIDANILENNPYK